MKESTWLEGGLLFSLAIGLMACAYLANSKLYPANRAAIPAVPPSVIEADSSRVKHPGCRPKPEQAVSAVYRSDRFSPAACQNSQIGAVRG